MKLYDAVPTHTKASIFVKEHLTRKEKAFLTEAGLASDSDIENMLKQIAKELEKKDLTDKSPEDVDLDAIETGKETTQEGALNEGLVLTLILASPTLLKLLGKLIDWAYSKLALSSDQKAELEKYKKEYAAALKAGDKKKEHELHDKVHASAAGKILAKWSHMAHEAFVWPIKKILQGVAWLNGNKWLKENAGPAAELIYACIMIGVAGHGIMHSLEGVSGLTSAVSKLGTNLPDLTHFVVDTLKGGDMTVDVLKTIFSKFIKA